MSIIDAQHQKLAKLTQYSVVVAGTVHNPSILNPDFLQLREIVPAEWGWEVASGSITTPPFAIVRFKSGVSITVEHEKLQVIDDKCPSPGESKAAQIASQYVKTLPHVRFTAVGINFQVAVRSDEPTGYIKSKFMKPGPWDSATNAAKAVGLRFVYPDNSGRLVLSIDTGESSELSETKGKKIPVVVVNANFHVECKSYPSDQEVIASLERVNERWGTFDNLVGEVIGELFNDKR